MGNSVSCFDPVREHPPYSWPKDHPDRAAAIADLKRKRRNQKIVGTQGTAHSVPREGAKPTPEGTAAAVLEEKKEELVVPTTVVEDVKEEDSPIADKAAGVKDEAKDEVAAVIQEPKETLEDAADELKEEVIDDAETASRAVPLVAPVNDEIPDKDADEDKLPEAEAVAEAEAEAEAEAKAKAKADADLTPVPVPVLVADDDEDENDEGMEDKESIEEFKDVLPAPSPVPVVEEEEKMVEEAADEPKLQESVPEVAAVVEEDEDVEKKDELFEAGPPVAETVPETAASSIDTRRAMFEQTDGDELPEPKELKRDVHDPVTGEYITLSEYRQRQKERARGVVKEKIENFEAVDDKSAKEKAELAAIEAVRTEAIEKAEWKFKTDGSYSPLATSPVAKKTMDSVEDIGPAMKASSVEAAKESAVDTVGEGADNVVDNFVTSVDVEEEYHDAEDIVETEAATPLPV